LLVSPSERNNAAVWIWFRISVSGGEGRKRAMAAGVKFGRKRKLSGYQRAEAIK
jgi:hypothetical protein